MDHVNPDGKDMSGKPATVALVHVYAQAQYHDDCYVVGNLEGLKRLRAALDKCISTVEAKDPDGIADPAKYCIAKAEVMTSDGEGYDLKVQLDDSDWQGVDWAKLALPYEDRETTGIIQAVEHGAIWPYQRDPAYLDYLAKKEARDGGSES